jgi:uncharacterized protein (TIGR02646 family)
VKHIVKRAEPTSLLQHRLTPGATYDNKPAAVTQAMREALVTEQGALCCYCMSRIRPTADGMKIEHLRAQTTHEGLQLDWPNLLGACKGAEGSPVAEQHCDTHKGDRPIRIDPTKPQAERVMKYLATGRAEAAPPFDTDVEETLNLNAAVLVNNRRKTVDLVLHLLRREHGGAAWTSAQVEDAIAHWTTARAGEFKEYCQVAVYWLRRHRRS